MSIACCDSKYYFNNMDRRDKGRSEDNKVYISA